MPGISGTPGPSSEENPRQPAIVSRRMCAGIVTILRPSEPPIQGLRSIRRETSKVGLQATIHDLRLTIRLGVIGRAHL